MAAETYHSRRRQKIDEHATPFRRRHYAYARRVNTAALPHFFRAGSAPPAMRQRACAGISPRAARPPLSLTTTTLLPCIARRRACLIYTTAARQPVTLINDQPCAQRRYFAARETLLSWPREISADEGRGFQIDDILTRRRGRLTVELGPASRAYNGNYAPSRATRCPACTREYHGH